MPLSSQLVTIDCDWSDLKRGSPCHLRGLNPGVSYRPPTTPPHLSAEEKIRCLSRWSSRRAVGPDRGSWNRCSPRRPRLRRAPRRCRWKSHAPLPSRKRRRRRPPKKRPPRRNRGPRPRRRNRRRRKRPLKRNAAANRSRSNTRGSVSTRRSRGHVKETHAFSLQRFASDILFSTQDPVWESAARNRRNAAALRVRLESWRPRGLHERLRQGLAHELHGGRSRHVWMAGDVRPLSSELLRARQIARLAVF